MSVAVRRTVLVAAVAGALVPGAVLGPVPAGADIGPTAGGAATVTLVVGRADGVSTADVAAALGGVHVTGIDTVPHLDATTVTVPAAQQADAVAQLAPVADYVHPSITYRAADLSPADPEYGLQAELAQIDAPGGWARTTGAGVVVAVVDTGILPSADLTDLSGTSIVAGYDEVDGDADPTDVSSGDPNWSSHGTLVATTLAARSNDFGIVGTCPGCQIMPVRVLGPDGSGSEIDIAEGIDFATTHGAQVINLSLGGTDSQLVDDAIGRARQAGIVVVAAAGNDGTSLPLGQATAPIFPADTPGVLSVAATCSHTGIVSDPSPTGPCTGAADGRLATFSGRGPWVDVAAPGVTYATEGTSTYLFSGTSASTPFVSGVAALIRAAHPSWSESQVRSAIMQTAAPVAPAGMVASGEVRAGAAVAVSGATTTTTSPAGDHTPPSGSIDAPGGYLTGTVTTSVHATDDTGVASVLLTANGVPVASLTPSGPGTWSGQWSSGVLADGVVQLAAVVTDTSGNASTTATVAATVDNQPPSVHLYGPRSGTVERAGFGVFAVTTDAGSGVRLTLVASGSTVVGGSSGTVTVTSVPVRRSGTLVIRAAAVDRAGHISFSNPIVVVARPRRR